MTSGADRRRHARRSLDEEVFCYVAGERLDASTADISLGGMFIRTDHAADIAEGTLVALVFQSWRGVEHPTYLFGRVVRRQAQPLAGIGLHWEFAVTLATPARLAVFLRSLFPIVDLRVRIEQMADGRMKSVFPFPDAVGRAPDVPAGAPEAPPPPAAPPGDVPPPPLAPDFVAAGGRLPHSDRPGAITSAIRRIDWGVPVSLPALLGLAGARQAWRVDVVQLDAARAFVRFAPRVAPEGPLVLRFEIRTPSGPAAVVCHCQAAGEQADASGRVTGIDLEILSVDEGNSPGIFQRYLKWLHFRALAGR